MITCSLEDEDDNDNEDEDEIPTYEDVCSFTCDTGYESTGSDTRTCQSDGSWSGNSTMCNKSEWFLMCMHYNYIHLIHIVLYAVTSMTAVLLCY